ncbi:MAG: winged helix-turn-helix transcriptional regulator [Thermoplasmata archaeon]
MQKGVGRALEKLISRKDIEEREEKRGLSLLMNTQRRRLLEYLCLHPCSSLSGISSSLEISPNTAKWHLDKLKEDGIISKKVSGRKTLYYPTGLISTDDLEIFEILGERRVRALYIHLVDKPGSTQSSLANSLKMSSQTISRATHRLESLGLVNKIQDGVYTRYFPSDLILARKEENFPREKAFQENVLRRLRSEGLKPKIVRRSSSSLLAEISMGRKRGILNISTDPFTTVLAED